MARTFGGVATDVIYIANYAAINSLTTLSISVWTKRTGAGGSSLGRIVEKTTGGWRLYNYDGAHKYEFNALRWATDGVWTFAHPAADEIHHIGITYDFGDIANDPIAYVDGSPVAVVETAAPAGALSADTSNVYIGNSSSAARNWAGDLSEVAVWNRILTAGEIAMLADGFSPLFILNGLVLYVPMVGQLSPEPNYMSANSGTVTGTVAVAHPRIIYPADLFVSRHVAAAGGLAIPIAMYHLQEH